MKLTRISAQNFKGLNFTLDLKDINFLVGSNFAGKTARTDAIRFLLLGYLPELGKTNIATFGLASGREMVVEGTTDTGLTIRRRLYLQGDSVKTDNQIPKEIEDAGQLAVMLNAETYFALSDRDRVSYVAANVKLGEGFWPDGIIENTIKPLADSDKGFELLAKLREIANAEDSTPQLFVERALVHLTSEAKSAKEYATRMEKGAQAVTTLKTQDAATKVLPTLAAIKASREAIDAELEELQKSQGSLLAEYSAIANARRRRAEIATQIRGYAYSPERHAGISERLTARLNQLQENPEIEQKDVDLLTEQMRAYDNQITTVKTQFIVNTKAITKAQKELAEIESKTICPYCGANGDGWKTRRQTELNIDINKTQQHQTELQTELNVLERGRAHVERAQLDILASIRVRAALEREVTACRVDLATIERTKEAITQLEQERDRLQGENPELQTKVEANQSAITVHKDEIAVLERTRQQVIARDNELQRIAQAEQQRDDAKKELETLVAIGKKLRQIQGEMVEAAFKPLLQTANSFFSTILKTPLAYHQGEIGTWRDSVWVSHRTFSGTEKALCYAAIQAALASKSPIRIMLIDELGRLDKTNATMLQACAELAIQGNHIDQFVGIDATNRYEADFTNTPTRVIAVT